jgi:hypothetical protein
MQFYVGLCDENYMITRLHLRDLTNQMNELQTKIISFIREIIECNILLSMLLWEFMVNKKIKQRKNN